MNDTHFLPLKVTTRTRRLVNAHGSRDGWSG